MISQCPFTDGFASTFALPPKVLAKIGVLAVRDIVAGWRGTEPVLLPAYVEPGATALMTSPDSAVGIEALIPPGDQTPSGITAHFGADIVRYFPGRDARKIQCPAHFGVCEEDSLAPPGPTLRHVCKAPKEEVRM